VFNDDGVDIGRRVSNREITDRNRSETKLHESAMRFQRFLSHSKDGIFLVNNLGNIIEWNQSQERITGIKKSKVIGKPFWDARKEFNYTREYSKSTFEINKESIQDALNSGHANWVNSTLDWVIRTDEKLHKYIQEHFFLIESGENYQVGCITRDITEIKRSAMELEELNASLEITCQNRTKQLQQEVLIREQAEEELKKYLSIEHALSKISRIFIQNISLKETIPLVLQRLANVTNACCVSLYVNDNRGSEVEAIYEWISKTGISKQIHPEAAKIEGYFAFCLDDLRECKSVKINDPALIRNISRVVDHQEGRTLPEMILLVPAISTNELLGILRFDFTETDSKWVESDDRFIEIISQIIGGALERGKIMDALERQVKDRTQEVQILYEIASLVSKPISIEEILKSSLQILLDSPIAIGAGFIHFQENLDGPFDLIDFRNLPKEVLDGISTLDEKSYIHEQLVTTMRPLIIPDLRKQSLIPLEVCLDSYFSYIGIPIMVRERMIGIISLIGRNFDQLTINNIALLTAVGEQIGGAIEGEFLRIQANEAAVIEERQRLARELHDSVTQDLYGLTLLTKGWQNEVEFAGTEEVQHWLQQTGEIVNNTLKEMRLLLYTLRPQIMLEREGLIGAVKKYLENLESKRKVKTSLIVDSYINLPSNIEFELFRIIQESLTNVVKHSRATELKVSMTNNRDYVDIQVVDNGVGFDAASANDGKGLGIFLMRDRARDINSTFSIESKPGGGTKVNIRVNTNRHVFSENKTEVLQ
jgi:PAS domain S-box-containing protein